MKIIKPYPLYSTYVPTKTIGELKKEKRDRKRAYAQERRAKRKLLAPPVPEERPHVEIGSIWKSTPGKIWVVVHIYEISTGWSATTERVLKFTENGIIKDPKRKTFFNDISFYDGSMIKMN